MTSVLPGTTIAAVRGVSGELFPSGSNVGVFLNPPAGFGPADLTLTTLFGQENTVVESATGPTLLVNGTNGDPATHYVYFQATAPFSGLRVQINTTNAGDYLVYELCGSGTAR